MYHVSDPPSGSVDRKTGKRQIKPPETLLQIEDLGESSDDSDFRIEDHCPSGSGSSSTSSLGSDNDDSEDDSDISDLETKSSQADNNLSNLTDLKNFGNIKVDNEAIKQVMICSVCLGEKSDDSNEIIECDGCGISVHEGCYGVQDTASVSSTVSSCSTEPWFCEACRAGIVNPTCELCPNLGGIFKETDVGKWVHLVCALYMPGVAFEEVNKLSSVTLFELPATKWGAKACLLCQDSRFASTGVTIECDAGMCRNYFHVTCGQREGLLSEATTEDLEQADPFYAHCRLHSDKNQVKRRKRNWLALQLKTMRMGTEKENIKDTPSWKRNQRKLTKYRLKYTQMKGSRVLPWIPMQKKPRLLTTSASACRALWKKAELMGIDMLSSENTESWITSLQDVPKKWNVLPAFSVEFIGYFLDRNTRANRLKTQLVEYSQSKEKLTNEQEETQKEYDLMVLENKNAVDKNESLKKTIQNYHNLIMRVRPNIKVPPIESFEKQSSPGTVVTTKIQHPLVKVLGSMPTAAALKAGVGHPLPQNPSVKIDKLPVALNNKCGICSRVNDQHLLAKCDTCEKHYHLGCLSPPLTRMPKKTKLMGWWRGKWQCSECDNNSSSSDVEEVDTNAPRKLRRSSKDFKVENGEIDNIIIPPTPESKKSKKRRRDKHRERYSPDLLTSQQPGPPKHHKKKRKSQELPKVVSAPTSEPPRQGIKLLIKAVPNSSGQANFVATQTSSSFVPEPYVRKPSVSSMVQNMGRGAKAVDKQDKCDTCKRFGNNTNMVKCDECSKNFHFGCLDPPVKKSPKVRGYSWHCADCDPTETDSD